MVSVFIGTSVDGFIARRNDELDFQPTAAASLPATKSSWQASMRWPNRK